MIILAWISLVTMFIALIGIGMQVANKTANFGTVIALGLDITVLIYIIRTMVLIGAL